MLSCSEKPKNNTPHLTITDFEFPDITIRALDAINDSTLWFAGSKGVWGHTTNSGKTWQVDTLQINGTTPELRSIKVTPNGHIYVVNIAHPAVIYTSTNNGANWQLIYSDSSKNAFFDAINFWNDSDGIILGDAQQNCFHLAKTSDSGKTWKKIDCNHIPPTLAKENPFAASNTNISVVGKSAWIGTGGESGARVFYTHNRGQDWKVSNTPIVSGKPMTGIFSTHFITEKKGVIAGGNWDSVSFPCSNIAISNDKGVTWTPINNTDYSGYISCAQFIPETNENFIFALSGRAKGGDSSMGLFNIQTNTWATFNNPLNYLSIQFSSSKTAWVSGKNYIGKMEISY